MMNAATAAPNRNAAIAIIHAGELIGPPSCHHLLGDFPSTGSLSFPGFEPRDETLGWRRRGSNITVIYHGDPESWSSEREYTRNPGRAGERAPVGADGSAGALA
jgi:hypothetical protein